MPNLSTLITAFTISFLSISFTSCSIGNLSAPTRNAKAINQNTVHHNGCGISSLINSYRFASPKWQTATHKITGNTDSQQFNFLASNYGNIRSKYSPGTNRWEPSTGISSIDLKELANDFQTKQNLPLPRLKLTTHYLQNNEAYSALLKRTHQHLKTSLQRGYPPIISIKHLASSKIEGHIVSLYQIPTSISSNTSSFPIKYVDPLGGNIKTGTIRIPTTQQKSKNPRTLSMDLPQSDIAKRLGSTGDKIVLSASITP